MLSWREVRELQEEQLKQCRKCKKNPQDDYCSQVWALGEIKIYNFPDGCKKFSEEFSN